MNQTEDEVDILLTVDAYADYVAGFINPDAVMQVLQIQNGEMRGEVKVINPEAEEKNKIAKEGGVIEPKKRPEIAERLKALREGGGKKVSQQTEEIDVS